MTFSQQYKKSNRGRDTLSNTFSFTLTKTKSIRNDFYEVFVQISGKDKKYLANIGTPANVQNNYIKLSGFGFNKTKFPHRGNDEKQHLSIKSSSTPKILSQFLITNL